MCENADSKSLASFIIRSLYDSPQLAFQATIVTSLGFGITSTILVTTFSTSTTS